MALFGVVSAKWGVFLISVCAALGSMTYPSISAMVSHTVSNDQQVCFLNETPSYINSLHTTTVHVRMCQLCYVQGAVQGTMTGIRSLCTGLGPALFGVLFQVPATPPTSCARVGDFAVRTAYGCGCRLLMCRSRTMAKASPCPCCLVPPYSTPYSSLSTSHHPSHWTPLCLPFRFLPCLSSRTYCMQAPRSWSARGLCCWRCWLRFHCLVRSVRTTYARNVLPALLTTCPTPAPTHPQTECIILRRRVTVTSSSCIVVLAMLCHLHTPPLMRAVWMPSAPTQCSAEAVV